MFCQQLILKNITPDTFTLKS